MENDPDLGPFLSYVSNPGIEDTGTAQLTTAWGQNYSTVSNTFGTGQEAVTAPEGCAVFRWSFLGYNPFDNDQTLVSAETEAMVRKVKDVVVIPLMFLIGGPANIVNMIVFYKQGLRERVNLCLFSLALADAGYVIFVFILYAEQLYYQFTTQERYAPLMRFLVNNNISGFYGLAWVSQILSALISSDRCLCVVSPLKAQRLLKTRVIALFIVVVYAVVLALYMGIVEFKYRIGCYYDPVSGTIFFDGVIGEFYQNNETLIEYLDFFVFGSGITVVCCLVVIVTTVVTVTKLKQAAAWRVSTASTAGAGSWSHSHAKDVALTKMLVGLSVLFIVLVSPIGLFRFVWLFLPELPAYRRQMNLYLVAIWLMEVLALMNAAFTTFIYYTMGSRYRETLRNLCGRKTENPQAKKILARTSHKDNMPTK